jgi:hypothetical protein
MIIKYTGMCALHDFSRSSEGAAGNTGGACSLSGSEIKPSGTRSSSGAVEDAYGYRAVCYTDTPKSFIQFWSVTRQRPLYR